MGSFAWGLNQPGYTAYITSQGTRHYRIRVGDYFAGQSFNYLVLANDNDASPAAQGTFSNVRLYDESQTVTHTYDAENRWIGRTVDTDGDGAPDERTVYVHDGGQVVLELEDTIASEAEELTKEDLTHRYLWGPTVDMLLADEQVDDLFDASLNETLWALTDHLGTVRDLVDDNGTVRMHREFDSFGQVVGEAHYDTNGNSVSEGQPGYVTTDIGYTGKQLDDHTGLQNNWNRWYDPAVGRWVSEDPIGFSAGDANLARYVENSSVNFVDPTGHHPATVAAKNALTRSAYRVFKRRLKHLTSEGLVQIHHVLLQDFYRDPKLGPFLKKIGAFKNDLCNTIPLPTAKGRIVEGLGNRSIHLGAHKDEYIQGILKKLGAIEATHAAGKLGDDAALVAVRKLQREAKRGLRDGSIKLIDEDEAIRKAMERAAVLAAVVALTNEDEFRSLMEEATESVIDQAVDMSAKRHQYAIFCAQNWTGEDGLRGWLGFGIDFVNPAEVAASATQMEYLLHIMEGGNPAGPTPAERVRDINLEIDPSFYRFRP